MSDGGKVEDGGRLAKYPSREPIRQAGIKRIQMGQTIATSKANGAILDSMRDIAQSQLIQLKAAAKERLLTASEAAALHRIAQVYNIVDSGTRREQQSMNFQDFTDEELAQGAEYAMSLLREK